MEVPKELPMSGILHRKRFMKNVNADTVSQFNRIGTVICCLPDARVFSLSIEERNGEDGSSINMIKKRMHKVLVPIG
jgi:hypothetical protein